MRTASQHLVLNGGAFSWPSLSCSHPSPWTGSRTAQAIWIGFVLVQALDGVLTCFGIQTLGTNAEGNPLIVWYANVMGPTTAVCGAKLFAVGCGAILYLLARYRTMAVLAVLYLLCAIGPWLYLLSRI